MFARFLQTLPLPQKRQENLLKELEVFKERKAFLNCLERTLKTIDF